jgi:hypothetical protein
LRHLPRGASSSLPLSKFVTIHLFFTSTYTYLSNLEGWSTDEGKVEVLRRLKFIVRPIVNSFTCHKPLMKSLRDIVAVHSTSELETS